MSGGSAAAIRFAIGLMLALVAAASTAPVAMAQPSPVKPWVPHAEAPCDWWLSGPNGKELHASIGIGDDDPVLTVADTAFLPFSESDLVWVSLRFNGDDKRRATAEGWVSSVVKGNERMLGVFLDAKLRRAMGGARRLEIFHRGKRLIDLPLANTPSSAALGKCTQPKGRQTDSE